MDNRGATSGRSLGAWRSSLLLTCQQSGGQLRRPRDSFPSAARDAIPVSTSHVTNGNVPPLRRGARSRAFYKDRTKAHVQAKRETLTDDVSQKPCAGLFRVLSATKRFRLPSRGSFLWAGREKRKTPAVPKARRASRDCCFTADRFRWVSKWWRVVERKWRGWEYRNRKG